MLGKEYFEMFGDACWVILNKKVHAIEVINEPSLLELLFDPIHESTPECSSDKNHGGSGNFARLHEGDRFEELIERAKPAGQDDIARAVHKKCGFTGHKMPKCQARGQKFIALGFFG